MSVILAGRRAILRALLFRAEHWVVGVDESLVRRWYSPQGRERAQAAIAALVDATGLREAAWGQVDGRWDLRGLPGPLPRRLNRREIGGLFIEELQAPLTLRDVSIIDCDFSGAHLESLRFFTSTLTNCVFDEVRGHDWRLWACTIANCRFRRTDLRNSALGPWHDGRANVYQGCDFSGADLRGAACTAARIADCDFTGARLDGIDFQSTSFVRVRFAGVMRDVTFWDHGFRTGKPDPNEMQDVDFTDAIFHDVDFRRVRLNRVKFPRDTKHIVMHDYPCVLAEAAAELESHSNVPANVLRALIEHHLKWIGKQDVGVFSLYDMEEIEGGADLAASVITRAQRRCARRKGRFPQRPSRKRF